MINNLIPILENSLKEALFLNMGLSLIQLITILGSNHIVWNKSATIQFKRPAKKRGK